MRRPLLVLGSIFTALLLLWGVFTGISALARTEERSAVAFDGKLATIRVEGSAGVTLLGGDGAAVGGERVVVRGLRRPTVSERVEGDTLVLRADCPNFGGPWCSVRYELTVPRGADIEVDTSGGGVRVEGVDGALELESSGGGITVVDAAGPIDADSSGGGITITGARGAVTASSSGGGVQLLDSRSPTVAAASSGGGVRLEFVDAPDVVDASSSGGGVTVRLPGGVAYAVDASSSGGGTRVDVATDPTSSHRITVRSSGGGVTVEPATTTAR